MSKKLSILTGRASIPAGTTPISPIELKLYPVSNSIQYISLFFSCTTIAAQDVSVSGWRVSDRGGLIVPESGSNDAGFTPAVHESNWSGCPINTQLDLRFFGREIEGSPWEVTFQFYNNDTPNLQAVVFLGVSNRESDINDLILEMKKDRDELLRSVVHANTDKRAT